MGHRTPAKRRRRSRRTPATEWVGGLFAPPFFVMDAEEPYRAQIALWLELPQGLILGQEVTGPREAEGALARALAASLEQPLAGSPRWPERIRVGDATLAAEVRTVMGDRIPIRVAPTPELDAVVDSMLEATPGAPEQEESYLIGGRVSPEAVAKFFRSAEYLYRVAPWRVATDDQVVRVDIPELGIAGACLSIIGALGESLGVLLFSSLADYDAFAEAAAQPPGERSEFRSEYLALSFDRGADLPSGMRREVAQHGWPVAAADAYPTLLCVERDAALRPPSPRDYRIAAACAWALPSFFLRHRGAFAEIDMEPVSESFSDDIGPTVHITAPFEAFHLFEIADERVSQPDPTTRVSRPGRNDPCPCGSGRKYKKCHLQADQRTQSLQLRAAALHALDEHLKTEISAFALDRFGLEARGWTRDFDTPAEALALAIPWSVYHFEVQGRPVFEWYVEEAKPRMGSDERRWLDAQRAAWLSVWEVMDVCAGESLGLRDLLSGAERRVQEVLGTEALVKRDCLLARVVELDDVAVIGGTHPRPLPPPEAAEVVRRARNRLRRKRAVPPERLRDENLGRYLIRRWEEAVVARERFWASSPQLRNTDGEPLILTTDHFELAPGARPEVASRLATLDGVLPPDRGDPEPSYDFLRDAAPGSTSGPGATLLASARLSDERLTLETNSVARADTFRRRIEETCGALVRHRAREHSDPLSEPVQREAAQQPRHKEQAVPPEARQMVLDFKSAHYAGWSDEALPALGGKSPREAVRTPAGRAAVDVLLKDMENTEQRSHPDERFDFSELRRMLDLDE